MICFLIKFEFKIFFRIFVVSSKISSLLKFKKLFNETIFSKTLCVKLPIVFSFKSSFEILFIFKIYLQKYEKGQKLNCSI